MGKEKVQTLPREEKQSEQEKELNPLSNLEVRNEESIPTVESAGKSGCGRCG